ncbi:hypothetical protein NEHOM01_0575 [Nematocida homosporus]|uniref:uncharacterized protein n=1 Tax=Nematocida homosporus TaxID=1912981 RepID=UPI002220A065|nr:uncharacterized protein NEHOM01_0575 [Nematocida homosporus]KAI5185070.1 hypothetical protein NEHOM01_0575 [Nematocida homosporus]
MRPSFELIGVVLTWLLGWTGKVSKAQDMPDATLLSHCLVDESGSRISSRIIDYSANPRCQQYGTDDPGEDAFGSDVVFSWNTDWSEVRNRGGFGSTKNQQALVMVEHCREIIIPTLQQCEVDLEIGLLRDRDNQLNSELQIPFDHIRTFSNDLKKLNGTVTNNQLNTLFKDARPKNLDVIDDVGQRPISILLGVIKFSSDQCDFRDLTSNDIKNAVSQWKAVISESSAATIKNVCLERQLRHFLYRVLRSQLYIASFINMPNTPLGKYVQFKLSTATMSALTPLLNLCVLNAIKDMPTERAVNHIYQAINSAKNVTWSDWTQHVDPIDMRLTNLSNHIDEPNSHADFTVSEVKAISADLDALLDHVKYVLDGVKAFYANIDALTIKSQTSSSIHECVDYVVATTNAEQCTAEMTMNDMTITKGKNTTKDQDDMEMTEDNNTTPSPSSAFSLRPWGVFNPLLLYGAISSLFWAHFTHLFGPQP